MKEKSGHSIQNFIKEYTADEKSIFGKLYNSIKKRDEKAKVKAKIRALQFEDDPTSDFDF